jgi:tetratricopeptide (TPR) repeat protein
LPFLQASAYANLGQYDRALYYYEQHLSSNPEDVEVALQAAEAYRIVGESDEAIKLLRSLESAGKLTLEGYNLLAVNFVESGELDSAAKALERAKKRFSDRPLVYFLLGEIYNRREDYKQMRENFIRYLELQPDSPHRERIEKILKQK